MKKKDMDEIKKRVKETKKEFKKHFGDLDKEEELERKGKILENLIYFKMILFFLSISLATILIDHFDYVNYFINLFIGVIIVLPSWSLLIDHFEKVFQFGKKCGKK